MRPVHQPLSGLVFAVSRAARRARAVVFFGACLSTSLARADTVAVEADALAYVVGGHSVALRGSLDNGLTLGVGGGAYKLPAFVLKSQSSYDAARWRATSESIQVVRAGYRFSGPRADGPSLDLIVLRQLWHLEAARLGQDTRFRTLGVGVSGGYWLHVGSHGYVYPTASVTYDRVTSGSTTAGGQSYSVPSLGIAGSVHVGWEL